MDDTKASLLLSRRMPQDALTSIVNKFRYAHITTVNAIVDRIKSVCNAHGRAASKDLFDVLEDGGLGLSESEQAYVVRR